MSKTYLGVDISGAVKLGLVDENGAVLRRAERSVSLAATRLPILDTVRAAIHEFLTADTEEARHRCIATKPDRQPPRRGRGNAEISGVDRRGH